MDGYIKCASCDEQFDLFRCVQCKAVICADCALAHARDEGPH